MNYLIDPVYITKWCDVGTIKVYDKMDSLFSNCSVYAVLKDGDVKGRVLFHISKAGVVTGFVQEYGFHAVMGKAGGYGYDKQGAALSDAINGAMVKEETKDSELYQALQGVTYDGKWQSLLRKAGYVVQGIV